MYEEGLARIKYTRGAFLNESARLLRDIGVAAVAALPVTRQTSLLDPTAATGIRGIRYYLEAHARHVTFLDINRAAYLSMRRNVAFNKVKAKTLNQSIQEFANTAEERFDVVDFDPFGGVAPSIYDILKMLGNNSMLMATATDTAVLSGAQEKACVKIYDAKPLHNELCHEVGIRILIGYIARLAAQFNLGIEVKLAMSYAHYVRITATASHGAASVHSTLRELGHAYYCGRCGFRMLERGFFPSMSLCRDCGYKLQVAGKLWCGKLIDSGFISRTEKAGAKLGIWEKSQGFLEAISEECDAPLYYSMPKITRKLGLPSVSPSIIVEGLRSSGFAATRTHFDPYAVKTDAGIVEITQATKSAAKEKRN